MNRLFHMEYWLDEGWYVGRLRDVPGVFSQGRTLEELEDNLRDAYRLMREEENPAVEGAVVKELAIDVDG